MVLETEKAWRGALPGPEVARGEEGDARCRHSEEQQEEAGERVQPQVKGQIGKPEGEEQGVRGVPGAERLQAHPGDPERHQGPQREEHPPHEPEMVRPDQPGCAHGQPAHDQSQQENQRRH